MRRNITTAIFSIFSSKIALALLGLFITPALVRLLGPAQYGEYAFLLSIIALLGVIVRFGVFKSTRKFIVEERNVDNWGNLVFGFNTRIIIINSLIITVLLVSFSVWPIISQIPLEYAFLISAIISLRGIFAVFRSGLMGHGLERRSEPLLIGKKMVFGASAIILSYIGFGVSGVLLGEVLALLIIIAFTQEFFSDKFSYSYIFSNFKSLPKKSIFKYNISTMSVSLLLLSLYHTDIIILQYYEGMAKTGLYKAALILAEFLWLAPMSVQIVLLHSSSELWDQGDTEGLSNLSSKAARYSFLFTTLLVLGLAALATPFVVTYYGPQFSEAAKPLVLLLPGALGFAVARPIMSVNQGQQDLRTVVAATGTASIVNILLNIILIPKFGMRGAAIATSVGYGSMFFLHLMVAYRLGFNPTKDLRTRRIITTAALSALVIFGLSKIISSPMLSLLVVPPVGFIVFSGIAIKLGAVDIDELNKLFNYR